jgi:hypothetical protein
VSGWSGFFSISARNESNKEALEAVANSNATTRAQFFFRTDAINIIREQLRLRLLLVPRRRHHHFRRFIRLRHVVHP